MNTLQTAAIENVAGGFCGRIGGYCCIWGAQTCDKRPWNLRDRHSNGYRVVFAPGAFSDFSGEQEEIIFTDEHELDTFIARQNDGTLHLEADDFGVFVVARLPYTKEGRAVLEKVRSGKAGMSCIWDSARFECKLNSRGESVKLITGALLTEACVTLDPACLETIGRVDEF